MNKINLKSYAEIESHIDESAISILESVEWEFEWIQFQSLEPNAQDLKILNEYFKKHPRIYLRGIKTEWLEFLPDVQMLNFSTFVYIYRYLFNIIFILICAKFNTNDYTSVQLIFFLGRCIRNIWFTVAKSFDF